MLNKKAFTLIELVMIIVILGIIAAVALPTFYSLRDDAVTNSLLAFEGAVSTGISTYYANECISGTCAWPDALHTDTSYSACSPSAPCFDKVLNPSSIDRKWYRNGGAGSDYVWYYPNYPPSYALPEYGYRYDSNIGRFWCAVARGCSCP